MKILSKCKTWIIIIICVLINWTGRRLADSVKPPLWLDTIGTAIAAIELGPLGGAVCGALSNAVISTSDFRTLFYIPVSIAVGISIGILYPIRRTKQSFHIISIGVFTGFLAAILSTPLNLIMYDGNTGNPWGDGLMNMLARDIRVPVINSFLGEVFVDVPDKVLGILLATGVTFLFKKIFCKERRTAAAGIIILVLTASLLPGEKAYAVDMAAQYAGQIYDTEDGLASVEINAVAQTNDGYIWVGTYSGIYRYDGYKFREMKLDDRIKNVMALYVDSQGLLWICTNDSGVACYDPETEAFKMYTTDNGLPSNVTRAVTEDHEGNIYIATISQLCYMGRNGKITAFKEKSLCDIDKLSSSGEHIAAIRHDGSILIIKKHKLQYYIGGDYTAVAAHENGDFVVGNSGNMTGILRLSNGGTNIINKYYSGGTTYCNDLINSEKYDGYFIACENGLGFMSNQGVYTDLTDDFFNSSIDDVILDYQGNIWFASSKQGIKRFTWNPFENIFSRAKLKGEVVNSVIIHRGLLYVAIGTGLKTIDLKTYYSVPIPYPAYFKDVRIRNIICDSKGNLWFCTYGENGLIELTAKGDIRTFNTQNVVTAGDRFKFAMETSDGTIVAASNEGLNFIKNDVLVKTLGERDGINAGILTLVEDEDGNILAGTDGDGIYVIKNQKIVERIGEENGLNTLVVMKIVPCMNGYIYVTSNALYYAKDGVIRRLGNFPYSNNYDVYLPGDGNAWVLSSAGIYVVDEASLVEDGTYKYILLNRSRGLSSSITANASYTVSNDKLYLCCTDGVRRISINNYNSYTNDFMIKISNLTAGEERISETDGKYVIPPTSNRIQFDVAILNYTLSNPLLHVYLEGADDEGFTCYQNEMKTLSFTNLEYGDYHLHVQVLDPSGITVQRDEVFHVVKESQIFERPYFKLYMYFVCLLFVLYVGWGIGNIIHNANSLEKWQKEASRDPLTGLLNKRGAVQTLTEACMNDKGILMILDLDSFKLVNDMYGHDVGDRMLISMAQMMKICTREEDILCRIGGDEFLIFLRNAERDVVIQDKTVFLNTEMLRAAKTYMGNDMNIPLGVSVGAVKVPVEGTDYDELFKKADKALYTVKNNGKHGYSVFSSKGAETSVDARNGSGLSGLKKILDERVKTPTPYRLGYDSLQDVYRILKRIQSGLPKKADIVLFEIESKESGQIPLAVLEQFYKLIIDSLGTKDIYCIDGNTKVFIFSGILGDGDMSYVDKIQKEWNNNHEADGYTIRVEYTKL